MRKLQDGAFTPLVNSSAEMPYLEYNEVKEPDKGSKKGVEEMAGFLRCLASGRDDQWEAICVDLDISVQGRSFGEVHEALEDSIEMYLERVSELPEHEQMQFLTRRSPWYVRAKFNMVGLWVALRGGDGRRKFTIQGNSHAHA